MLLKKVTSPVSFEDIRTFNGEDVYFKGLFTNSTAWQTRWGRVLLQGYGWGGGKPGRGKPDGGEYFYRAMVWGGGKPGRGKPDGGGYFYRAMVAGIWISAINCH